MIYISEMVLILFYVVDELGHGGPVKISPNTPHYDDLADKLIKASTELGIPMNKSYNSGNSQGMQCL